MTIPALGEQLLPHMTRTLAAGIGIRMEPRPDVATEVPAASAPAVPTSPAPSTSARSALAEFLSNSEIEPTPKPTRDYSTATPLAASLPTLQRAS